jgi:hypothetical protein
MQYKWKIVKCYTMPEAERDTQQMTHKKESLNSNPSHDSDFPLEKFSLS